MNGKDYEIPQNRERCIMVSVLGDYYYDFPKEKKLKFHIIDLLELSVDEKYYLKGVMAKQIKNLYVKSENCEQIYEIEGSGYNDMTRRVYSPFGVLPTIRTCTGGNTELKIAEVKIYDYYNKKEITDGCLGTLTTASSHNGSGTFFVCEGKDKIRKITPKEAFRFMGVKDEDFERVAKNQSNSSLYYCAGDSIVTTCLMAIFGEMLDVDWHSKIQLLYEGMKNESTL